MHQSRKHMTPIFHVGQVQSIQPGPPPQLTVIFSGGSTAISNISYLASYSPQVGDFCHAIHTGKPDVPGGADWLVIGAVAQSALGKPIFSGYASASQALAVGTNLMDINTVVLDTANAFNVTPGVNSYTAPVSGYYRVSGQAKMGNYAVDIEAQIFQNGGLVKRGNHTAATVYMGSVVNAIVYCPAGQPFQFVAYAGAGSCATNFDGAGQDQYFDIELVS